MHELYFFTKKLIMAYSKGILFSSQQQRLAKIAKAIAHPARIAVIDHLIKHIESSCGEIVSSVGLAQPTVSQHLKELKEVGIVSSKGEGNLVKYKLNAEPFELLGLYIIYVQHKLKPQRKLKTTI